MIDLFDTYRCYQQFGHNWKQVRAIIWWAKRLSDRGAQRSVRLGLVGVVNTLTAAEALVQASLHLTDTELHQWQVRYEHAYIELFDHTFNATDFSGVSGMHTFDREFVAVVQDVAALVALRYLFSADRFSMLVSRLEVLGFSLDPSAMAPDDIEFDFVQYPLNWEDGGVFS